MAAGGAALPAGGASVPTAPPFPFPPGDPDHLGHATTTPSWLPAAVGSSHSSQQVGALFIRQPLANPVACGVASVSGATPVHACHLSGFDLPRTLSRFRSASRRSLAISSAGSAPPCGADLEHGREGGGGRVQLHRGGVRPLGGARAGARRLRRHALPRLPPRRGHLRQPHSRLQKGDPPPPPPRRPPRAGIPCSPRAAAVNLSICRIGWRAVAKPAPEAGGSLCKRAGERGPPWIAERGWLRRGLIVSCVLSGTKPNVGLHLARRAPAVATCHAGRSDNTVLSVRHIDSGETQELAYGTSSGCSQNGGF